MPDDDPIEAVIQALQRQMNNSLPAGSFHSDRRSKTTLSYPHDPGAHSVASETTSEAPRTIDSIIKARYASTVLRIAQTSDLNTAARLVSGLARDLPLPNELPHIIEIHLRAIDAFVQLLAALNAATSSEPDHVWRAALDATADWRRVVEAQQ